MEIRILDTNFIEVTVVENYTSFIWTDRYAQYGDFEIYAPMGEQWMYDIQIDYLTDNIVMAGGCGDCSTCNGCRG